MEFPLTMPRHTESRSDASRLTAPKIAIPATALRRHVVAWPILALVLLSNGCSEKTAETAAAPSAALNSRPTLTLSGSSALLPLMTDIARRFETSHPGVRIEVAGGGSGRGIADAREGKVDIGMVSRALGDKEKDLQGFAIARDGIAVLVHRDNPVSALKREQLRDIYTGKTTRWKAVGGKDADIVVVTRDKGRSSLEPFTAYLGVEATEFKAQQSIGDNAAVYDALKGSPNAIVFISLGESERRAATEAIKLLAIDGVAATRRNVSSGNYPVSRALSLVTQELPAGVRKEFVDYSLSPLVADLVDKHHFIPYLE